MQRVQANMTLFYKSNTIAGLLLHVHLVILNHHNCAATPVYFTNTCKNEQTTFVKKKKVVEDLFCGYHCRKCTNMRSMQVLFHIFSGTTKRLNCSIYGNDLLKLSTISLGRKNHNHIRNRRVILNWA